MILLSTESTVTELRNALVVRGGWPGHHPVETTDVYIPYLESQGYRVLIEDSPAIYAHLDVMKDMDLILQCITMGTIGGDEFQGLDAAIQNGTGFAGWHGGIVDAFRTTTDYLQLVGGQFAKHPPKPKRERAGDPSDNLVPHSIEFTDAGAIHPITAGIDNFSLTTEQYWVLTDEYNTVLATTTHASKPEDPWDTPVSCPAIWTRQWGRGRVFVATPGHTPEVLEETSLRTIIERGLLWASR